MEIHNYQPSLEYWTRRIGKEEYAKEALAFISHLKTKGLNNGRVCAYASRLPNLQKALAEVNLELQQINSTNAEDLLGKLLK